MKTRECVRAAQAKKLARKRFNDNKYDQRKRLRERIAQGLKVGKAYDARQYYGVVGKTYKKCDNIEPFYPPNTKSDPDGRRSSIEVRKKYYAANVRKSYHVRPVEGVFYNRVADDIEKGVVKEIRNKSFKFVTKIKAKAVEDGSVSEIVIGRIDCRNKKFGALSDSCLEMCKLAFDDKGGRVRDKSKDIGEMTKIGVDHIRESEMTVKCCGGKGSKSVTDAREEMFSKSPSLFNKFYEFLMLKVPSIGLAIGEPNKNLAGEIKHEGRVKSFLSQLDDHGLVKMILSKNLHNAIHRDVYNDVNISAALWLQSDKKRCKDAQAYFLLPNVTIDDDGTEKAIAIKIEDGTYISWDGRAVWHCTSRNPALNPEDNDLYACFVTTNKEAADS